MANFLNITGKIGTVNGYNAIAIPTIENTNSVTQQTQVTLIEGDNEIAVPANAIGCIVQPNSDNLWTLKLKKEILDTGIQIHKTNALVLSFDPSVTVDGDYTFILNSADEGESPTIITFF